MKNFQQNLFSLLVSTYGRTPYGLQVLASKNIN